ncbi:hypothetical protein Emin_1081 [Elusimicrobium minutum Pei191]|uniref:Phage tail protein n=1 Tax=Elusimicrobium minutum (strain Pei191) TaxID=445932 RepID=B2KDN7_ELUMP|nr:hypothetical protein [Elusimicrobium minutum]ACC98633.1 hypothetical protein Emin_1081 [Elusimicrobium minutum Pei191]
MALTNIVVGVQGENTIQVAPYGIGEENSRNLGLIKGGVTIEHDTSLQDIMVDQYLAAVDQVVTSESLKIKTTMAEATLTNLAAAMGLEYEGSAGLNLTTADGGYYTVYINVKGPKGKNRKYTFWKCKINGKTTQVYKRDGETVADIEFNVLADTEKPSNQRFGTVTEG